VTARAVLLLLLAAPTLASAASRPRYGGLLRVASATAPQSTDPLLADSPAEAALLGLTTRGVCRLDRSGRVVPELALSVERPAPAQVRVTLLPALRTAGGEALAAQEVAQSWSRLNQPGAPSPYRALLYPLKGEGRSLAASVTSQYALDLPLAFPWPDLEKSLCHPALAPFAGGSPKLSSGIGPFLATRVSGPFTFNVNAPEGRPYVDRLTLAATDERGATRAFAELHQADVALGTTAGAPAGPLLYATYLVFRSDRTPATFRQSVESAIDRADLTRFFVRGPGAPLFQLLPPALMPNDPVVPPARPATAPQELTLLYDAALLDQKWVAERIQVRLHDLGYRIQLRALPRASLRAAWAIGDFDAMLHAVLLPPVPASALAVVLEVAGRHDALASELPPLGAIADAGLRDAKVRERATALAPTLPLIPLYVQGVSVQISPRAEGLSADGFGLPTLDDVFLVP
jgi:hypothetical protein